MCKTKAKALLPPGGAPTPVPPIIHRTTVNIVCNESNVSTQSLKTSTF